MAVSDSTPIGARFEKLSVISGPTKNKYGIAQVHCRCECGAEKTVNCADLRDGKIKSCGCWRKDIGKRSIAQSLIDGKYRGITANDRYGHLMFLRAFDQDKNGKVRCEFQCDCGSKTIKSLNSVISGHIKSCGCGSPWNTHLIPIIGERWGRLTVIEDCGIHNPKGTMVSAKCICGVIGKFTLSALRNGRTKSCGCLKADGTTAYSTHGHTRNRSPSKTYAAYQSMIVRCTNPKTERWLQYGGRGIRPCDRWLKSFENFLEDMGPCPRNLSLDRIDVNGNYEPENCRWATNDQQVNNKQSSHFFEFFGEIMTVSQWAARTGIAVNTLYSRIKNGWSEDRVLTPVKR